MNRLIAKNKIDDVRQDFFETFDSHISDTSSDYVESRLVWNGSGTINESSIHVNDFSGFYNHPTVV